MNPDQEAKFKARFEAEESGEADPKFAERLAKEEAELEDKMVNPAGATIAGAAVAYPLGRILKAWESGADVDISKLAERFKVPADVVAKGDNAVMNYIKAMHVGDINYVGGESYKEAHELTEAAKNMAKNAPPGFKYDPDARQYIPEAEYETRRAAREAKEKARLAAERKKLPLSARVAESSPAGARAVLGAEGLLKKGVPPFVGRTIAGGFGGYSGAEAYNRAIQGDVPGAAVSGIGAAGGALSLHPNPKIRALGILGMGASALGNQIYKSPTIEPPSASDIAGSVMRNITVTPPAKATGGLVNKYAGGKKVVKAGLETLKKNLSTPESSLVQTVKDPLRMDFPGIYERPDIIAQRAVENTAAESPLLKQLFGVTREDLFEMSKRKGNVPGEIPGAAKNPKGSAAAEAVMVPQNEQRLLDIFSELQTKAPGMYQGMHGWYVLDPMYQRLVQLVGEDKAGRLFKQLNTFGGIESPNMPVPNEFRRASAAHMLAEQGRFPEWQKYGGLSALEKQGMSDYPADLMTVPGRVGHKRAATSQNKFLETGEHGMDSPKAPPYIQASSVPELGFQTNLPVGDAHWSRGIGLADVRTGKSTAESVSTPEIQQLAPWWREKIAEEVGTESVPAQAILWGGLGPYTGVKTAVGAPKLELKAIEIGNAAKRLGINPEEARDLILLGKERAGKRKGGLVYAE